MLVTTPIQREQKYKKMSFLSDESEFESDVSQVSNLSQQVLTPLSSLVSNYNEHDYKRERGSAPNLELNDSLRKLEDKIDQLKYSKQLDLLDKISNSIKKKMNAKDFERLKYKRISQTLFREKKHLHNKYKIIARKYTKIKYRKNKSTLNWYANCKPTSTKYWYYIKICLAKVQ